MFSHHAGVCSRISVRRGRRRSASVDRPTRWLAAKRLAPANWAREPAPGPRRDREAVGPCVPSQLQQSRAAIARHHTSDHHQRCTSLSPTDRGRGRRGSVRDVPRKTTHEPRWIRAKHDGVRQRRTSARPPEVLGRRCRRAAGDILRVGSDDGKSRRAMNVSRPRGRLG